MDGTKTAPVNFPEERDGKRIYFYCDRRACESCKNPFGFEKSCNYTADPKHAENFFVDSVGNYFEKPRPVQKEEPWFTTDYGRYTLKEWAAIERYEAAKKDKKKGRP